MLVSPILEQSVKYREAFVSRALNEKFSGIFPAGIYRGFVLNPSDTPMCVRVTNDEDWPASVAIVERDGYSVTITMRDTGDVQIPSVGDWFICIEALYSVNQQGYQRIIVRAEGDVEAHHVILGRVSVTSVDDTLVPIRLEMTSNNGRMQRNPVGTLDPAVRAELTEGLDAIQKIIEASEEMPAPTADVRGGVRVDGKGLQLEDIDKLMIAIGNGLSFDGTGKLIVAGGVFTLGDICLKSFRPDELPFGWYFCNNDRYANDTPQGNALNALSANFKLDWSITDNGVSTNVPNLFHVDGRGVFLRTVDGTLRFVGSLEDDAIRNITGRIESISGSSLLWDGFIVEGVFSVSTPKVRSSNASLGSSDGAKVIYFDPSRVVPTSYDNHSLNVGMTPAIYLGV